MCWLMKNHECTLADNVNLTPQLICLLPRVVRKTDSRMIRYFYQQPLVRQLQLQLLQVAIWHAEPVMLGLWCPSVYYYIDLFSCNNNDEIIYKYNHFSSKIRITYKNRHNISIMLMITRLPIIRLLTVMRWVFPISHTSKSL
jgi:hypothetical protein